MINGTYRVTEWDGSHGVATVKQLGPDEVELHYHRTIDEVGGIVLHSAAPCEECHVVSIGHFLQLKPERVEQGEA